VAVRGPRYCNDEIIVCTYIARFRQPSSEAVEMFSRLFPNRSAKSIRAKIGNIAAMLRDEGLPHSWQSYLTGTTTGRSARRTNWEIVRPLTCLSEKDLLERIARVPPASTTPRRW